VSVKRIRFSIILAICLCLVFTVVVLAQTQELKLSLSRDFGYGWGGDIQGLFSMHVSGPADLAKVEFYIDETKIGEDTETPFALQFQTDDYPLGIHTFSARGSNAAGQVYTSNTFTANFVPPQSMWKFLGPVLGIVFLAILGAALMPLLMNRGKLLHLPLGAERNYGLGGGGICPKCKRPFPLPILSMNLGLSKFTRCPYCGKWNAIRVQTLPRLREAEKAELLMAQAGGTQVGQTEEEKTRKEIDESKYQ
jgi:hypothetical protein